MDKLKRNKTDVNQAALGFEGAKETLYVRSERRAWYLVFTLIVLLLVSWVVIALMMPLKQVQPYVVQVNQQTGYSRLLTVLKPKDVTDNEVLNNYWLAKYVKGYEGYNWYSVQLNYNNTLLFSSPNVAAQYAKLFTGTTALNKVWGNSTTAVVHLLSPPIISSGNNDSMVATVRFTRTIKNINQVDQPKTENLVATIGFGYQSISTLTAEQRLKNPLGFTVYSYEITPEL